MCQQQYYQQDCDFQLLKQMNFLLKCFEYLVAITIVVKSFYIVIGSILVTQTSSSYFLGFFQSNSTKKFSYNSNFYHLLHIHNKQQHIHLFHIYLLILLQQCYFFAIVIYCNNLHCDNYCQIGIFPHLHCSIVLILPKFLHRNIPVPLLWYCFFDDNSMQSVYKCYRQFLMQQIYQLHYQN